MTGARRGKLLTALAILYLLASVVDIEKAISGPDSGTRLTGPTAVVLLGIRQTGVANTIAGLGIGSFLVIYAAAIWRMSKYAIHFAGIYATYVTLNVMLYSLRNPFPHSSTGMIFDVTYKLFAVAITWGTVVALKRRTPDLA